MNKNKKEGKGVIKMEIRIKIKVNEPKEIEEVIKKVKEIEKEHSCSCTLLEVEVN